MASASCSHLHFVRCDVTKYADTEARPREWVAAENVLRDRQFFTDQAHLVFEQHT